MLLIILITYKYNANNYNIHTCISNRCIFYINTLLLSLQQPSDTHTESHFSLNRFNLKISASLFILFFNKLQ